MSERTGLGVVDTAVLTSLAEIAPTGALWTRSMHVVRATQLGHAVEPAWAYGSLRRMTRAWGVPMPLVELWRPQASQRMPVPTMSAKASRRAGSGGVQSHFVNLDAPIETITQARRPRTSKESVGRKCSHSRTSLMRKCVHVAMGSAFPTTRTSGDR